MTTMCLMLTTAGSADEAKKIAHALVAERRLASCVNIIPRIESVYRWKGEVESAEEWLLLIKTRKDAFERVRAAIEELHSYELPECIMLEIAEGDQKYLDWLAKNTE